LPPPGIRIIIHDKPTVHRSWAPHGIDGWYLGPALRSYCCYTVWAANTQAQHITDTVAWLLSKIPMPTTSSIDYVKAGIANILHALQNPWPNSLLSPLMDSQVLALKTLMLVLHGMSNPNQPSEAPILPPMPALPFKIPPPGAPINKLTLPNPAASLRVQAPSTLVPALRVPTEDTPNDTTVCIDNRSWHISLPPTIVATMPQRRTRRRPHHSARLRALYATHTNSPDPCSQFMALHRNAFNLDTRELAEYKELSHSSDGDLW